MAEEKKVTKKKLTFRERLALATYEINKQELKQSGSNPFFGNSKYSTLHDLLTVVRPILEKYGLFQTFKFCVNGENRNIIKMLVRDRASDEMEESCFAVPDEATIDPQKFGSFSTYIKRYSCQNYWNMSSRNDILDDDGNAYVPHKNPAQKSTSVPSSSGNPAQPKIEEGTQPTKDFWFSEERKYLYKFQKECESVGIDKGTFWDFAFDNYKTKYGKLKQFDDIHYLPPNDKERLMSDVKNGLNQLEKAEEQPELVEVDNDGGIGDDDIPF